MEGDGEMVDSLGSLKDASSRQVVSFLRLK